MKTDTHKRLMNYMAGWHAGAGVKTIDPELQNDHDYNKGWSHGKKASALAYETACHFLDEQPMYIKAMESNLELVPILDKAVELCSYCRTHEYPVLGTPEFSILSGLVDKLDTELRKMKLIPQNLSVESIGLKQEPTQPHTFDSSVLKKAGQYQLEKKLKGSKI